MWDRDKNKYTKTLRYIYILHVDNVNNKSRFYGQTELYYTGQTKDLQRRIKEHLSGINSNFLNKYFRHAYKKLVYVGYIYGNENDAQNEEFRIKKLKKIKKEELIKSEKNKLILYKPCKSIVLKDFYNEKDMTIIKLWTCGTYYD